MTIKCLEAENKRTTDLDALTDDQRADIDRLLMIVWRTHPANYSVKCSVFGEKNGTGEPEESLCCDFRQVCGL